MKNYTRYEFDNRDAAQMYEYLEARIQALKARIGELERENETLRRRDVAVEPPIDSRVRWPSLHTELSFEAKDGHVASAATAVA